MTVTNVIEETGILKFMGSEQDILLERVKTFKFRWEESFYSLRYILDWDNFWNSERIDVHYAVDASKLDYVDIVEFWLNSLFNFLEDRFEDDDLEKYAAQSKWKAIDTKEILRATDALFFKFGISECFEFEGHTKKSFLMLQTNEVTAFLIETENRYTAFYWHAATS